jgi:hypothetical protein
LVAAAAPLVSSRRISRLLSALQDVVLGSPATVAYVQQQLNSSGSASVVTWQYVSHDGGRRWIYSTALGGS